MIWDVFNAFQKTRCGGCVGCFMLFGVPLQGPEGTLVAFRDGVCVQGNEGDFAELMCGQLLLTGVARSWV